MQEPGLCLIATRLLLGSGAWVDEAVRVASALVAQGCDGPATVEVAALTPGTSLSEAAPLLRALLEEQGVPAPPEQPTESERYEYVSKAFGLGVLGFREYVEEFYANLPEWGRQSPLQQRVVLLLDDWDTETSPDERAAVAERVRAVVAAEQG